MNDLSTGYLEQVLQLDFSDRVYVLNKLWESLMTDIAQNNHISLDTEQEVEIERRLNKLNTGKSKLYKWEEVRKNIVAEL